MMLSAFLTALSLFCCRSSAQHACLPLGPSFVPTEALSKSQTFQAALGILNATIEQSLANGTVYGQLDPTSTSFSVDIWSLHDDDPLYTYHFSAPDFAEDEEGVKKVDSDTVYRLGSMSKLITVYTFLLAAGDTKFRQPVTQYVPELAAYMQSNAAALQDDTIQYVDWNSITLEALASQMSGIFRDFAFGPLQDLELTELGLPPVKPVDSAFCGPEYWIQVPCNRSAFFANFFAQYPSTASFHTPAYSNSGYQILSYALESIVGKDFPTIMQDFLLKPLGLESTFTSAPPSPDNSIVPFNDSWSAYSWDFGDESPAAGYYSSINDLRKIGKSMLNSTLLPKHVTHRWMKPITFTGEANVSVGSPWEIIRAPTSHVMWMYTKGGHVGSYATEIILLPDLDIGFTVLTAGAAVSNDVDLLSDLLSQVVVPAAEEAGREDTRTNYAGTYTGEYGRLDVLVDEGPGLVIGNWTFNGTDAAALYAEIALGSPNTTFEIRLWPTTLKSTTTGAMSISWRAVVQELPIVNNLFLGDCISWLQIDQLTYGGVGLDEFTFTLEKNGNKAVVVTPRAWRTSYSRS